MGDEGEFWEGESCCLLSLAKNEANREEGEEKRVTVREKIRHRERGRRMEENEGGGERREEGGEEERG